MQRCDAANTGRGRGGKSKTSTSPKQSESARLNVLLGGRLYVWLKEKEKKESDLKRTTASSCYSFDVFPFTPCLSLLLYSVLSVGAPTGSSALDEEPASSKKTKTEQRAILPSRRHRN